jgi:L-amino acid N-acyltransferase YncA
MRSLTAADWPHIAAIYAEGMADGNATFEIDVPSWDEWDAARLAAPRLVAEVRGVVAGFAALSAVSSRAVYRGVADVMIYVGRRARGQGVGRRLLEELVAESESAGIWTLQAGVFPENEPSLRLHESCGFRRVGVRERLGQHQGVWRDVVLLERRSATAG